MRKGDIILVPFPFTDLSGNKVRPALVLQASAKGEDFICAFVSSVARERLGVHEITVAPSASNGLKATSCIKLGKLATLQKTLAVGILGYLELRYMEAVEGKLRKLLGL